MSEASEVMSLDAVLEHARAAYEKRQLVATWQSAPDGSVQHYLSIPIDLSSSETVQMAMRTALARMDLNI